MNFKNLYYVLSVILIGLTYFSFEAGLINYLWQADISKLSFVIIGLFIKSFVWFGHLIHRKKAIQERDIDVGYETSEIAMGIGMLGTVIGFISMMSAFAGVDLSSLENIRQLFDIATSGMSTALLTTAAGLTCALFLRVMYYILDRKLFK